MLKSYETKELYMELHPIQKQILEFIRENGEEPFGIRELQYKLELTSPGFVSHHLAQLEKKGLVIKNLDKNSYRVDDEQNSDNVKLPFYGSAKCGLGGLFLNNTPEKFIEMPREFFTSDSKDSFVVQASGDSMESKIHDRDYIVGKPTPQPRDGTIIICSYDGEVLIKKYKEFKDGGRALMSLNDNYAPRIIDEETEFLVAGEVIKISSDI